MADQSDPGSEPSSATRGIVGLVVANSSLILAVLIYMGWAYDNALYGYFHLNTLDLGFGTLEYVLRSLSLFSPALVVVAVAATVIMSVRARDKEVAAIAAAARVRTISAYHRLLSAIPIGRSDMAGRPHAAPHGQGTRKRRASQPATQSRAASTFLTGVGIVTVAAALSLYWAAAHLRISTFLVLAFLGAGPLLLAWPARAARHGRGPYALAIVIAAICALWAAAVHAEQQGTSMAETFVQNLQTQTAVAIYSTQRLDLSGPGVIVQLLPAGSPYHYRYTGLRLLLAQTETYYLVPVSWTPQLSFTYVVDGSDQTRIELY